MYVVRAFRLARQGGPDPTDATSECRTNAGFVKIYRVLLDNCAIYDGRVTHAICFHANPLRR